MFLEDIAQANSKLGLILKKIKNQVLVKLAQEASKVSRCSKIIKC